ncbi:type I-E CRISPR-associated protein Cse1/CasA [Imhoffiella purpurea]|uniref:CRISPR-associated protein, Cse1 family n=1 Tax=Imhoffiella purpurea TaxID=1249627 RepID=W9VC51_9GAMM|nr:type I-E CRISPR-associated protein Cse1/CasA [Imhoffiella purpurea]EXJ14556.1 hypothetical protein D779_2348 [Imhoffiella purpurea]
MDLLEAPWIPVRANNGSGAFRLLTYRELLCTDEDWQISLSRDDLELACLQLLICMTQIMFLPTDDDALLERLDTPLTPEEFEAGISPCRDWFDLDHPTQPFMQTRGVVAKDVTPIQKLLIGLPEGTNHAFFNAPGEVGAISAPIAAIALFHQATNCPSFGGGFKGSLRGGAPITTLVDGRNLRERVWRNVLIPEFIRKDFPDWTHDPTRDRPTWIDPIREKETIHASQIGLARGLFWQPAHVELVPAGESGVCDLLGIEAGPLYTGFRKEKFNFTLTNTWPHPHGVLHMNLKKKALEMKFASFTTQAPAWTRLTEMVIRIDGAKGEGSRPAAPIAQAKTLAATDSERRPLHLIVGGYRNKQASVLERRHELITLAAGWDDDEGRLKDLVELGLSAKKTLRGKLYFACQGYKDKDLPGIGVPLHETGERLFYARTESKILATFSNRATFDDWRDRRSIYVDRLAADCRGIFDELTDPYTMKPELIPIIAWARRSLNADLKKLKEGK